MKAKEISCTNTFFLWCCSLRGVWTTYRHRLGRIRTGYSVSCLGMSDTPYLRAQTATSDRKASFLFIPLHGGKYPDNAQRECVDWTKAGSVWGLPLCLWMPFRDKTWQYNCLPGTTDRKLCSDRKICSQIVSHDFGAGVGIFTSLITWLFVFLYRKQLSCLQRNHPVTTVLSLIKETVPPII